MLNAHSAINWRSEIFHEFHERGGESKDRNEPIRILHDTIKQNSSPVLGIEVKFQHLDSNGLDLAFGDFLEVLVELGFQDFIVLKRNHYLRQAISVARGQQSKMWHIKSGERKPEFSSVEMDLDQIGLGGRNRELTECFEFLDATYENAMSAIKKTGYKVLQIQYELELESDPHVGYEKAVEFLELREEKPDVSLQKLGGQSIEEMVTDFSAIEQRLKNTAYAWMLEN